MSTQLAVNAVSIRYSGEPVLRDVSFTLESGQVGCLLGPSGCGKTSLLRAIAGFEPVASGEIRLQESVVSSPGHCLAPERRQIGMVFQDFALFPHLTVAGNIAFGLHRWEPPARQKRVAELLQLVGLAALSQAYPHQLSGGQQQRVALVRAMAPRPKILLLDEPFSSLDSSLREQLAREVRQILKLDGISAILVTHDHLEAFAMADRIAVLGQGLLHQWDSPYRVYHRPANRFVADFVGQGALLWGKVNARGQVETELGQLPIEEPAGYAAGTRVEVLVRPDDVIHDDTSPLRLEIVDRAFRGAEFLYSLRLAGGGTIFCMVQSHHDHAVGDRLGVRLALDGLALFPEQGTEQASVRTEPGRPAPPSG